MPGFRLDTRWRLESRHISRCSYSIALSIVPNGGLCYDFIGEE